jgi:hypothetical protein
MGQLLDAATTWLEALDYSTTPKAEGIREASAEGRWNFVYTEDVGGLLLRSSIPTTDGVADLKLYDLVNDLHAESVAIRFYLDDEGDLALEAWWPPVDDPEAFEVFMQAWDHDVALVARHPAIGDLLE